jgi:hypothetical protein
MVLSPQWLDGVIEAAIKNGYDANAIAGAIAHSPRFLKAIQEGIEGAKAEDAAKAANPKIMGASSAQKIRTAIQHAVAAAS